MDDTQAVSNSLSLSHESLIISVLQYILKSKVGQCVDKYSIVRQLRQISPASFTLASGGDHASAFLSFRHLS